MFKLVEGVGIYSGKYPRVENNKIIREYYLWNALIRRCYSNIFHSKNPTYIGCSVSENFKNYDYFYEWFHEQIGFNNVGWHIDKDILLKGNKVYSEDSCVFVPKEINALFTKRQNDRGRYAIGVRFHKDVNRFDSRVNKDGKSIFLGYFDDEFSAFMAYKLEKEKIVKIMAERWKDCIDIRVYQSLLKYTVDFED